MAAEVSGNLSPGSRILTETGIDAKTSEEARKANRCVTSIMNLSIWLKLALAIAVIGTIAAVITATTISPEMGGYVEAAVVGVALACLCVPFCTAAYAERQKKKKLDEQIKAAEKRLAERKQKEEQDNLEAERKVVREQLRNEQAANSNPSA